MTHQKDPRLASQSAERLSDQPEKEPLPEPGTSSNAGWGSAAAVPMSGAKTSRRFLWLGGSAAVLLVCFLISLKVGTNGRTAKGADTNSHSHAHSTETPDSYTVSALSVRTVRPRRKTLERTLVQPGSIAPWAQAELYAKASGYLRTIQRETTPQLVADLWSQGLAGAGTPIATAALLATDLQLALEQAPQIDIGASVSAGELLLEIDMPERLQDIVEKESLVAQRNAELEAARTALHTFEAAVESTRAQIIQAEADVRKFASEYLFRTKELKRLNELALSRTVTQEIADEKQHHVNAAQASWESSKAKVQTVQAELAVVSSKLAAARADLKVREALVQVARDELRRACVLENYSRIHAPFNGVVTYRGMDEGDFVQNATSGQARRLMTVTALDKVKVVLQVPESDASWIQVGTEATVVVDARARWHVKGCVNRIPYSLEAQTRTMRVEIDLDNRDRQLLPGMYGRVTLSLQKILNAQALPATALYSRKGENFIILVQDGVAHRQRVRVRYDDGKEVEVVQLIGASEVPLDGTEELIVSNKGEIADGQRVETSLTAN